jgi:hypothetical protein
MLAADRTTTMMDNPFFRLAMNGESIDRFKMSFVETLSVAWTIAHVVSKSENATPEQKTNARAVLDLLRPTRDYVAALGKALDGDVAQIPPSHEDYRSVQNLLRWFSEYRGKTPEVVKSLVIREIDAHNAAEYRKMRAKEQYLVDRTDPPSLTNMYRPSPGFIQVFDIVSLLSLPFGAYYLPGPSVSDPRNSATPFFRNVEATGQGGHLKGGVASSQRNCTDTRSIGIVQLERTDKNPLGPEDVRQVLDATGFVVPSSFCISEKPQKPRAIAPAYQHFHPIDRLAGLLSADVPIRGGSWVRCTLRASLPPYVGPHCAALLVTAAKEGPECREYLCIEGVVLGTKEMPVAASLGSVEAASKPAEKKRAKPQRGRGRSDGQRT